MTAGGNHTISYRPKDATEVHQLAYRAGIPRCTRTRIIRNRQVFLQIKICTFGRRLYIVHCRIILWNISSVCQLKQSFHKLNTILYYTILYYTILYYTILYYTILYYTILYYTILYHTILYHTIPYHTILYYS